MREITQADVERYVGLPYREGEYDCADLAQQVLRELFGIEIALPQDRTRYRHPSSMLSEIVHWRPMVARRRFDRSPFVRRCLPLRCARRQSASRAAFHPRGKRMGSPTRRRRSGSPMREAAAASSSISVTSPVSNRTRPT